MSLKSVSPANKILFQKIICKSATFLSSKWGWVVGLVFSLPSFYASSRQWALLPHNSSAKYQEKCWHSALVELLPRHPKLSTHKKVRKELARSLQANKLTLAAQHREPRPGYQPIMAGGMCMQMWGAQQGHSHQYQQETLYIVFFWGRRRKGWKDQLPKHLPSHPWVPCAVCLSH